MEKKTIEEIKEEIWYFVKLSNYVLMGASLRRLTINQGKKAMIKRGCQNHLFSWEYLLAVPLWVPWLKDKSKKIQVEG
jgi:hypothetical protein